ncbi:SCP2 sterol-binding domain-containing protein [Gammaproteobacteria bacterium]|nr:SCP2 sterol-binding domain-containing protein [Gammaproteobacteria bacterium]
MTLITSATAAAIETALRAKNTLDDGAREAIERLNEKCIVIEATGLSLSFRFAEGRARVLASTDPDSDLKVCGSLQRIFEIMLGKQADGVSLEGDLTLLEDFRRVFKPALEAQQLTDQMRSAAELGVGAMRSAVDGVANEVARRTNSAGSQTEIDQLKTSIEELTSTVAALQKRLEEAEKD